jgi:protoporphyrinogen/coproporphyrinogen III oxidase
MNKQSAIIIGAGLTGLTTAFYLKRAGWDVTIIERAQKPGGSIQTFREDGFIFESGPNTGIVTQPEVTDLFNLLGPDFKFEPANEDAKRRLIWKDGRWYALPQCIRDGIRTPLFAWKDKFKLLFEPFRKKGNNPDESLEQLVRRRMGTSFLNYAVDPFILGIYAGDPSKLITRFALPKLYQLEQDYGSFIKGSIKKHGQKKTPEQQKVTRKLFSVTGGLENLVNALVSFIGEENFIYNCRKVSVYPKDKELFTVSYIKDGETHTASTRHVVTTTGAGEVDSLLPFLNQTEKQAICNLTYAKVIQVAIGFKKWRGLPLKAFGGLVPHIENRKILGILFPSVFLKGRAPDGGALLSVFMGGVRNPEMLYLDDAIIKSMVMDELKCMLLIPDDEPDLFRIFRHHHAIPQYGITTGERLTTIAKIESQFPGLIMAGNLRDGIGMADRIRQGTLIAKQMEESVS